MKKILMFVSFLIASFIALVSISNAAPVQIVSSYFEIGGNYSAFGNWGPSGNYHEVSNAPLSNLVSGTYYNDFNEKFDLDINSEADFFFLKAETSTYGGRSKSYASAEWIFRPLAAMDTLTIFYYVDPPYAISKAVLMDFTEGKLLINAVHNTAFDFFNNIEIFNYNFKIDHLYSLYFYAYAESSDDSWGCSIGTFDLKKVPESTSFLMTILGFAGILLIAKLNYLHIAMFKKFDK